MNNKKNFSMYACIVSITLLWTFIWFQYSYDSRQAVSSVNTTVSNLSKAFEENILGTIRHLDEFLVTIRREYPYHLEQIPVLIASYNRHSDKELIIQLSITDEHGIMTYNTKEMPDKPLDLSDREHIRVQLNSSEDKLFISKPVLGRVSKKWSVQFTRKIMKQDGSLAGVAVLSVDPDYFSSFYRNIDIGKQGVITLVGMDGIIRARSTSAIAGADPIGKSIPSTNAVLDSSKPPVGTYHAPSNIDGVNRIASYRRLKSYPLLVMVGLADEEAFSVLRWHRNALVMMGILTTGGLILMFWLALRFDTRQLLFTRELEDVNNSLKQRIDVAIAEIRQKDQVMISQSRQAAMGEMIGNIAHQWRQPLNALSMVLANIQASFQYNELTADYLDSSVNKANGLIQKMSSTINDFRNFFLPDKEIVAFSAMEQIRHAVSLVESGLKSQNITVQLDTPADVTLNGFPNEYSQVLLNLFSNSRDAIKEVDLKEGKITINLYEQDGRGCVVFADNGGGIPANVIDKIFEPYFSTKSMGTGIGLYMSKMIIERSMKGTLEARNIENGAEFTISIPSCTSEGRRP
ncbi:MAG: ATP-binding protein [Desulfuromonadales bacterium]